MEWKKLENTYRHQLDLQNRMTDDVWAGPEL